MLYLLPNLLTEAESHLGSLPSSVDAAVSQITSLIAESEKEDEGDNGDEDQSKENTAHIKVVQVNEKNKYWGMGIEDAIVFCLLIAGMIIHVPILLFSSVHESYFSNDMIYPINLLYLASFFLWARSIVATCMEENETKYDKFFNEYSCHLGTLINLLAYIMMLFIVIGNCFGKYSTHCKFCLFEVVTIFSLHYH